MRRIDDPGQHVLAVTRLLPSRNNGRALDLIVDIVVLVGQLDQISTLFPQVESVELIGLAHRVTQYPDVIVRYIS